MAYLPDIIETQTQSLYTTQFPGYRHRDVIADGETWDEENLTGERYPLLSTRRERRRLMTMAGGRQILQKTGLAILCDDGLYYPEDGEYVKALDLDPALQPKFMTSFGAYICVWPDKKYYNTVNPEDVGDMAVDLGGTRSPSIVPCDLYGNQLPIYRATKGTTAPENPADGDMWLDTATTPAGLMQYSEDAQAWILVTVYTRISYWNDNAFPDDDKPFEVFGQDDVVTIDPGVVLNTGVMSWEFETAAEADAETIHHPGATHTQGTPRIRMTVTYTAEEQAAIKEVLTGEFKIFTATGHYIVIKTDLVEPLICSMSVLKREVPDFDFAIECGNRIWGCRYGEQDGEIINEIRASALGNFKNFSKFSGDSTDSFAASIGSDGPFTGAATLKSYPLFWKENCLHRVSGNVPGQMAVVTTQCRGVQQGSAGSLQVVGESLIYKSRQGVMLYDGSVPMPIGEALGPELYGSATAGALADRYWISMQDSAGDWHMFCYDTRQGTWHREDATHAVSFAAIGDDLVFLDAAGVLWAELGSNPLSGIVADSQTAAEGPFPWQATFGIFGYEVEPQKYLSRFNLRMQLEPGAWCRIGMQYDSDGDWTDEGVIRGTKRQTFTLPVLPVRCDHCQLRLTGEGGMRLYSIGRVLDIGGDEDERGKGL